MGKIRLDDVDHQGIVGSGAEKFCLEYLRVMNINFRERIRKANGGGKQADHFSRCIATNNTLWQMAKFLCITKRKHQHVSCKK